MATSPTNGVRNMSLHDENKINGDVSTDEGVMVSPPVMNGDYASTNPFSNNSTNPFTNGLSEIPNKQQPATANDLLNFDLNAPPLSSEPFQSPPGTADSAYLSGQFTMSGLMSEPTSLEPPSQEAANPESASFELNHDTGQPATDATTLIDLEALSDNAQPQAPIDNRQDINTNPPQSQFSDFDPFSMPSAPETIEDQVVPQGNIENPDVSTFEPFAAPNDLFEPYVAPVDPDHDKENTMPSLPDLLGGSVVVESTSTSVENTTVETNNTREANTVSAIERNANSTFETITTIETHSDQIESMVSISPESDVELPPPPKLEDVQINQTPPNLNETETKPIKQPTPDKIIESKSKSPEKIKAPSSPSKTSAPSSP
ncbi:unnamed protein product, partial [Owenia fusiformis]